MSLSSLIVQREIATIRQVEEALARQVIYGGDLVTNLFEVARVDEATVTEMLAESYGLAAGRRAAPADRARPRDGPAGDGRRARDGAGLGGSGAAGAGGRGAAAAGG